MVRLLHALAFAALAVVATATPELHTTLHVAKQQTAVAFKAQSTLHRDVHSGTNSNDDSNDDAEEDNDDGDDNDDATDDDDQALPVCTDDDLEVLAQFADDAQLAEVCGADNVEALQDVDVWSVNTCRSQECWDYVYESLETKVPACIAQSLASRLKVCGAKEEQAEIPQCTAETDSVLGELSEALELESVCGADIASNFTVEGLSSIKACDNEACLQLLLGAVPVLPICQDGDMPLHNLLSRELRTCAGACSNEDYEALDLFVDESQFVEHCGNRSVKAIKARSFADVDVCASPQCEGLMYFAIVDNVIPMCRDRLQSLLFEPFSRALGSCHLLS